MGWQALFQHMGYSWLDGHNPRGDPLLRETCRIMCSFTRFLQCLVVFQWSSDDAKMASNGKRAEDTYGSPYALPCLSKQQGQALESWLRLVCTPSQREFALFSVQPLLELLLRMLEPVNCLLYCTLPHPPHVVESMLPAHMVESMLPAHIVAQSDPSNSSKKGHK